MPIAMQAADKEDAILIAVTRNGQFFLSPGNAQVHLEDIPGKVRDLQTNKLDKTCYIKSDARAKYEAVEDVVDNLRAAGVDQIGLITEQSPKESKPARPRRRPDSVRVFKGDLLWHLAQVEPERNRKSTSRR